MYDPENSIIGESFIQLAPYLKVHSAVAQRCLVMGHGVTGVLSWGECAPCSLHTDSATYRCTRSTHQISTMQWRCSLQRRKRTPLLQQLSKNVTVRPSVGTALHSMRTFPAAVTNSAMPFLHMCMAHQIMSTSFTRLAAFNIAGTC